MPLQSYEEFLNDQDWGGGPASCTSSALGPAPCVTMCAASYSGLGGCLGSLEPEHQAQVQQQYDLQSRLADMHSDYEQQQVRWRALGKPRDLRVQGTEEAFRRGRSRKTLWQKLLSFFQSEY